MKLNSNKFERNMGIIFMVLWFIVLIIYMTWDGWIYEWLECGYSGPNQHFDLDLLDMKYYWENGEIHYISTNNLHNIIYLCFFTFFAGWFGLLFDNKLMKQTNMAILVFPVSSLLITLFPLEYHIYFLQIIYDVVHLSGIIMGVYLFYTNEVDMKRMTIGIFITWGIYILSRALTTPWPYWEHDGQAYFSINQANDMPFYFYGLEYGLVVAIFVFINFLIKVITDKWKDAKLRMLLPIIFYVVLMEIFLLLGLIELQDIHLGTCN